jgi:hypothetical protein
LKLSRIECPSLSLRKSGKMQENTFPTNSRSSFTEDAQGRQDQAIYHVYRFVSLWGRANGLCVERALGETELGRQLPHRFRVCCLLGLPCRFILTPHPVRSAPIFSCPVPAGRSRSSTCTSSSGGKTPLPSMNGSSVSGGS